VLEVKTGLSQKFYADSFLLLANLSDCGGDGFRVPFVCDFVDRPYFAGDGPIHESTRKIPKQEPDFGTVSSVEVATNSNSVRSVPSYRLSSSVEGGNRVGPV